MPLLDEPGLGAEFVSQIQWERIAVCPHCGKEVGQPADAGRPLAGNHRIPTS